MCLHHPNPIVLKIPCAKFLACSLAVFKQKFEELQLDFQTLFRTTHIVTLLKFLGGKYIYIGLKENIITGFKSLNEDDVDVTEIKLIDNVDGVPFF